MFVYELQLFQPGRGQRITEFLWSQETIFKVREKVVKKDYQHLVQCYFFFNQVDSSSSLLKLILKLNRFLISYHALTSSSIIYLLWLRFGRQFRSHVRVIFRPHNSYLRSFPSTNSPHNCPRGLTPLYRLRRHQFQRSKTTLSSNFCRSKKSFKPCQGFK